VSALRQAAGGAAPAPELSAIVVAYESEALVERCLRALAPAAGGRALEVLVMDNGSSDATVARAEAVLAAPGAPAGAVVRLGANRGFAAAANAGAARARGRLLVFVNTDAFPDPGALDTVAALFDAGADAARAHASAAPGPGAVALASGVLVYPDGRRQRTAPELPRRRPLPDGPTDVSHLRGACLVASAAAFRALGGFDERFFFYLEETDLCLRARAAGLRVVLHPGARVVHLGGATAARFAAQARVERDAGRALLRAKHALGPPAPLAALADGLGALGRAAGAAAAADALYVCAWHLRGRPEGWGLKQSS
jgi:GT2 family glycosyltransferase